MKDLITKKQAAEMLCVSVRTLEGLIARGQLTAYRVGPKAVRLKPEEIEAYLAGHVIYAKPAAVKPEAPRRVCRYFPGMKVV